MPETCRSCVSAACARAMPAWRIWSACSHWQRCRGQIDATLPPAVAARGLCALVDGLMLNWLLDPQAFDLQSTGSQMLDTYLRGLTGRNVQPPAPVRIKEVATEH